MLFHNFASNLQLSVINVDWLSGSDGQNELGS